MSYILIFLWSLFVTNAAEPLTMRQETSIKNIHFLDGRLGTYPIFGSVNTCISECYMDPACVSIAYSSGTSCCQRYEYDVANFTVNVIQQDNTIFYKVVCDSHNYTYIRSLNICMRMYYNEETFNDSLVTCADDQAHLLQVDTVDIMDYLNAILAHIHEDGYGYFLGGYGLQNSTQYHWSGVNGGPDIEINENNGGFLWGVYGAERCSYSGGCCLSLQSDGQKTRLASADCAEKLIFICVTDI